MASGHKKFFRNTNGSSGNGGANHVNISAAGEIDPEYEQRFAAAVVSYFGEGSSGTMAPVGSVPGYNKAYIVRHYRTLSGFLAKFPHLFRLIGGDQMEILSQPPPHHYTQQQQQQQPQQPQQQQQQQQNQPQYLPHQQQQQQQQQPPQQRPLQQQQQQQQPPAQQQLPPQQQQQPHQKNRQQQQPQQQQQLQQQQPQQQQQQQQQQPQQLTADQQQRLAPRLPTRYAPPTDAAAEAPALAPPPPPPQPHIPSSSMERAVSVVTAAAEKNIAHLMARVHTLEAQNQRLQAAVATAGKWVCIMCSEAPPSVLYLPCMHLVACRPCHETVLRGVSSAGTQLSCPSCQVVVPNVLYDIRFS